MTKDSEPDFPVFPDTSTGHAAAFRGMTLRDYFAAKAMQGMMANRWNENYAAWAEHAYMMADAMMEARK